MNNYQNISQSHHAAISQTKLVKTKAGKYRIPKAIQKDELYKLVLQLVEEDHKNKATLSSAKAAKDYLHMKLIHQDYESFYVVYLNSQHQVISIEEMFKGTINQSPVFPREIVKRCVQIGAGAVILCHCHPSGNAQPSSADRAITDLIVEAMALIDVRCIDHFIIGGHQMYSFAEHGLL